MQAGFLGVGNMGLPMAGKLLDGGHSLTVYDIRDAAMQPLLERQARKAASPKDLADQCEIVFVSLPTLAAFRGVAFGPDGLANGSTMKLLVNTCTIGVPFVKEIEQAMAARASLLSIARSPAARRAPEPAPYPSWSPAIPPLWNAYGR
jgi:3-hydroxyisobutyrate dehydrogenase-like beta-hydroxyacid dehydrogenase